MMLTYRRIETEANWPEIIWTAEDAFPAWFRAASRAWTPDFEAFERFWQECDEIYGLFDEADRLKACVYLEHLSPVAINIHLSVIEDVDQSELVRFYRSLRNLKAIEGVRHMEGWMIFREKRLREIAERAGFTATGLVMRYGNYKGRAFEWSQVRA